MFSPDGEPQFPYLFASVICYPALRSSRASRTVRWIKQNRFMLFGLHRWWKQHQIVAQPIIIVGASLVISVLFGNFFWAAAFGCSAFLATYAFQLHTKMYADDPKDVPIGYGKLRWSQTIHQFILHFTGAFLGWIILYLFIETRVLNSLDGWEKIVLGIIVFISITGYLPHTLINKNWLPGK